jgi:CheY-like chemotaxis protein
MGGDISVESIPLSSPPPRGTEGGHGSTFSFGVQLELADSSEIEPERPTRRVIGLADGGPYRILVVDDSADNRALLVQLLGPVGFEIREAVDGRQALELYQSWQPHLIWMDIRMPVMDGYQASQAIKAGNGPETVIIAVTASVFEEERAEIMAAGCDDFVRKPFREEEIFEKMAEHLGVAYLFEELEPVAEQVQPAAEIDLTAADLASLPAEWIAQLREAASRGRSELLRELIDQIKPDYVEVAAGLTRLVNDLQFRKVVALTEQV